MPDRLLRILTHAPVIKETGAAARHAANRRRFYSWSGVGILGVFLLFVAMGVVLKGYTHMVEWVDHSREVRKTTGQMIQALTDVETAERGYLLTRQQEYLADATSESGQVRVLMDNLGHMTMDNPDQTERVARLRSLVDARLDDLDKMLVIDKKSGLEAARRYMRQGSGLVLTNRIRVVADTFRNEEALLLDQRQRDADLLFKLLVGGLGGSAIVLVFFLWYGLRALETENRLEREHTASLGRVLEDKEELLRQRELLLQEVNHRVKNSLNQVAGMLRLQVRGMPDDVAKDALMQALNRIGAIGRVHEQMYKSEQMGQVDIKEYLEPLSREIVDTLMPEGGRTLDMDVDPLTVPMDRAVPLTLIVNELLTNAVKYGWLEGRPCKLAVELKKRGKDGFRLRVSDNGPGLPADFEPAQVKSLGMRLVTSLCRQLDGTLTVESGPAGTQFEMVFEKGRKAPQTGQQTGQQGQA